MEIKQVYDFVNYATETALGKANVINEDLSNIIDVGEEIFNANAMDKYVNALVNRIGKTIFVNRVYRGSAPSVMMDGWEYGSVLQKVSAGLPEATANETWELQDGQSYDPHVFHAPKGVTSKFYNKYVTFEIDMSFTEDQLKMSFQNATQLNGFISMLYTNVENSMTVKIDELIRRTIVNMASIVKGDDDDGRQIVNLKSLYESTYSDETLLSIDQALTNPKFVRLCAYTIKQYQKRLQTMTSSFNLGRQPRFTPTDDLHVVLHSDVVSATDVYLQSDTFHNELTKLPQAESVSVWQGLGTGEWATSDTAHVQANGEDFILLGVMFDRWALGVSNVSKKVTSQWTPNAEFFTNFYKYKAGFFNDLNENCIIFIYK